MATVRDILLRRKAWSMTVKCVCYFLMIVVLPLAVRWPSSTGETKLWIAVVGSLTVIVAMFSSSRWARCPRCAYNLTGFGLRRREKLQVNVCAHCGLPLDRLVESKAAT